MALSYAAPSSCPTQGRFVTRLRMHTQRVQLSNEPDALTLHVVIVRAGQGFTGTLEVAQPGRPPGTRSFEAADCPDVVWALALSAALSIDPEATLTVTSEDEAAEPVRQPYEAAGTAPAPETTQRSASEAGAGARKPAASDVGAPTNESLGRPSEDSHEDTEGGALWSIGPALSASFAFDPKAAIGAGFVTAVRDTSGRHVLPLELALRVEYLGTRLTRGADPLTLDWWSANLLACPLRGGEMLTVLLCGVGQAGLIRAKGVEVEQTAAVSRSFFSLGLGLWARQRLSDQWELSGVADCKVPLVERAFALGPDLEVVVKSRPVGVSVSLGAAYGF